MIGGELDVVQQLDPLFATPAPSVDSARRTQGRGDRQSGGTGRTAICIVGRSTRVTS
jgi:hypothetical protein